MTAPGKSVDQVDRRCWRSGVQLGPESHLATNLAVHIGVDAPGEELDSALRLRAQSDDALQLEVSQEMLGMLRCGVGDVHVTGLDTTVMGRGHCACWWRQCTLMEAIRVPWRTDREPRAAGWLKHDGLHTTAPALSRRGAGARGMHGGRVRIRASKGRFGVKNAPREAPGKLTPPFRESQTSIFKASRGRF